MRVAPGVEADVAAEAFEQVFGVDGMIHASKPAQIGARRKTVNRFRTGACESGTAHRPPATMLLSIRAQTEDSFISNVKVLLLYPEFPDTFWSFKHALKFVRKRASLPPLGLLTVAAMLPPAWEKRLVDLNVRKLKDKDLRWADLVFISAMIVQRESAQALIARCRAAGKTIVAGGPLFTSEHEQFPGVDHFVLNEAEVTLPEFLRDFEQGYARPVYTSTELPDIRQTPEPLWELANFSRYASMCIQYSRGCPFDCEFCDVTAKFGHRPRIEDGRRRSSPSWTASHRLGWRGPVFFVDDNLIGNKRALKTELLPALIEWQKHRRGVPFYTEASINLADDEELMKHDGRGGLRHGVHRHRDAGRGRPGRVQQAAEPGPRPGRRREAHPARGPAGAGRLHRRVRQRHADDLPAADRVHPEERHRDRDGRAAQRAAGHEALCAAATARAGCSSRARGTTRTARRTSPRA